MRTVLSAIFSFSLGCVVCGMLPSTAFATDFAEDTIQLHDILLKRSYTDSIRAGDALYLWDNFERARYVDRYQLNEGKLQFKQRISLPGMPLIYNSASEEEVRPPFYLTSVGNKVLSHSTHRLNLLDSGGNLLADPLGNNDEYRELFGYSSKSKYKAQFVSIGNDGILAWNPALQILSRWRLNAADKLELLIKNKLNFDTYVHFISNGAHHFLLEQTADGKTKVHRPILTNLQLGKTWEAPGAVFNNSHWVTGLSQLAYVDAERSTSANIRRLNLGDSAVVETIAGADFKEALGLDGRRLYYRNLSDQLCQLELVNGQAPSCQAMPAEINGLASIHRIDQQVLLLAENGVFLQFPSGALQQLQPSAINRGPDFLPGFAVVPQGVVIVNNWQLLDHEKNITQLTPRRGPAAACTSRSLYNYEELPKIIRHARIQSVVAQHQDCTAIHQIKDNTEVTLHSHSFQHPGLQFLAYNGSESMLVDRHSVVHVKRNNEQQSQPLASGSFKASAAIASASGWYFSNLAAAGRSAELYYLPLDHHGQQPLKFTQQATPHFAVSGSHLYGLDKSSNGQIQIASWRNNNGQLQHQTDVQLPEHYKSPVDHVVQMEIRNTSLLVWTDTVAQPDHRSLLVFDLKNPDQPQFSGAWTNPLDNRENYNHAARIAVDLQDDKIILQPYDSNELLLLDTNPVVDPTPRIIEQSFVVNEDSRDPLKLTLKNATGMQLHIRTMPTKGTASVAGDQLHYQPNENFNGDDSVVLILRDALDSYEFPITLHVTPVNDPPVVAPIAALSVETGKTSNGQAMATDVDSDKLYYRISETGTGTVSIGDDGKFSYLATVVGADAFVIEVQDKEGAKANVRVSVTASATSTIPPSTVNNDKKSGGSLAWSCIALALLWRLRNIKR